MLHYVPVSLDTIYLLASSVGPKLSLGTGTFGDANAYSLFYYSLDWSKFDILTISSSSDILSSNTIDEPSNYLAGGTC